MTTAFDVTVEEQMAVHISRKMRDWETCACGAISFIPAAGMLLGRELHAPNLEIIIRGSGVYNQFVYGRDMHFLAQKGQMDVFFIGGIEIDKHGDFNLHVIGDRDAPDVLMPGQYGTGMLYYAVPRIIWFRTEHSRRTFVEKVSYVSGAGTSPPGVRRRNREVNILTPMAWMKLNQETHFVELASVHPGHTLEEVQDNTSFDLGVTGPAPMTPPITEEEIRALRTVVKDHMIETDTYPELARTRIRTLG